MSYQPSVLEQLQLDMGGRIAAHPPFANVPVKIVRPRSQAAALLMQTEIDQALEGLVLTNGVAGVTVLVNMPSGNVPNANIPGPRLEVIATARVIESPLVNMGASGTGVSAEDYALEILNLLASWYSQDLGGSIVPDRSCLDPVTDFLIQGKIAYDIRFRVPMGLTGPPKVARPVITGSVADGATIAAGEGLSVYYTTDGSYPTPIAPTTAQLYTPGANIPVVSGTRVRAVAYSTSTTQASDLASLLVP